MGVVESIKDIIGIHDDAQDFYDTIGDELSKLKTLTAKLESVTGDVFKRLSRASSSRDVKDMRKTLDSINISTPVLLGRNMMRKISDIKRKLGRLEAKLRKLPTNIQGDVTPKLKSAIGEVDDLYTKHAKLLRLVTKAQEDHRAAAKHKMMVTGTLVAGITAVAAAGIIFAGYSTTVVAMRSLLSVVAATQGRALSKVKDASVSLSDSVRKAT